LMCFPNDTWSINHISFNIQNKVATLTSCFSSHSSTIAEDILVKWNNNNHFSVILNIEFDSDHLLEPTMGELQKMTRATIC
jgi:hypothetical protein